MTRYNPRHLILAMLRFLTHGCGWIWVRFGHQLGLGVLVVFMVCLMVVSWLTPDNNWDSIAYVMAALEGKFSTQQELHNHVWGLFRDNLPADIFADMSTGSYRLRQFSDPIAFQSMLGMYEVKWLYVGLLSWLIPVFGTFNAIFVIDSMSMTLFTGVCVWWLHATKMGNFAPLLIAVFLVAGLPDVVIANGPDVLNIALVAACLLTLDRGHYWLSGVMGLLAVLARPDAIVLIAGLMVCLWLWTQRPLLPMIIAFALSVFGYIGIQMVSNHPGWWAHLWFSTYHIQDTMVGFNPEFSLKVYFTAFVWNLVRSAFENTWLGIYVGLLGWWAMANAGKLQFSDRRTAILAASLGAIALKFIAFPLHDARTYISILIPVVFILFAETRDCARKLALNHS